MHTDVSHYSRYKNINDTFNLYLNEAAEHKMRIPAVNWQLLVAPNPNVENLNCQSEEVVYAIKCSICKAMHVGETSRKLHERFTEHTSNINAKKSGPVAKHFNEICPNMDFLTITPLDKSKGNYQTIHGPSR